MHIGFLEPEALVEGRFLGGNSTQNFKSPPQAAGFRSGKACKFELHSKEPYCYNAISPTKDKKEAAGHQTKRKQLQTFTGARRRAQLSITADEVGV